ncbi:EAL domain-containing protein [Pseudoduganella namucuonensis]|uniref:PAS domain S-box-containing protein/diguanylate cyclase (GGDEF) domain-containing protein n=1 Tax=Pseudoduganella namucuonensis TaxID=1035707 RepID=A0A1I7J5T1_9BURK|nr:EAL domain-containing protein [Pseudoduganella namucuonensis]SFU80492.1 PAS domain S-box-containing protein/diguanylate cyclase (GGDEF) domain-containing protein [Pseudoduganella namucuonensis]
MDMDDTPAARDRAPQGAGADDPRQALPDALSNRALSACSNGVMIADAAAPDMPIMYANPAFCAMTGYPLGELLGRNCRFLQGDDQDQPALAALRQAIAARQDAHVVVRNYRKDGTPFWNDLFISPVPDALGVVTHYVGIATDVTALKEQEASLAFHRTHDKLTGLPNRDLAIDRLQQAMQHALRHNDMLGLLCVGVDNYHLVNESLGHAAGDQLLAGVAQRLRAAVRPHDTVALLGGDEFVVILEDVRSAADVAPVCENVFAALAPPFQLDGQAAGQADGQPGAPAVHASASIGVTLCPQDGKDGASLLRYADMALARAREQGGGKYQYFSSEMNHRTLERIGIESALRLAVLRDELQLQYQALADLQTGEVASLEALVRWQHPALGLIPAQRFVPVAEETGLIHAIGAWVLRRVCQDLCQWRDAGLAPVRVAVNVSPKQFLDRGFAAATAATLAEFGLPPSALALEITEGVLLHDPDATGGTLAELKALGVALVLDDFGTGYSSLSCIKRFPFDAVKIDGAFIRDIVTDSGDAALSKTIIAMAHHLGIQVAAEGVETEAQCDFLRRHMCDLIQGYFFAPPLAADAVRELLRERRSLPPQLLRIQQQRRALLLVDDEQNIISALKRLLRRDGYTLYTANSGQEGLEVLAQHPVDVIVSDQRMPGMLGADFLRKAKELYPDTIRIMLSGYTELQSVTDAVNEGAIYKFLTKPWEDELLRGHIADAFRLKEIADDNERLNLELRTANHGLAAANRRMEDVLRQQQQQLSHGEVSLHVARELLQHLPLPVIGMDDGGMIAFVNAAADRLLRRGGALLGNEAGAVLPQLFPADGAPPAAVHEAEFDGVRYAVMAYPMGEHSASRGSLIALSRCEAAP